MTRFLRGKKKLALCCPPVVDRNPTLFKWKNKQTGCMEKGSEQERSYRYHPGGRASFCLRERSAARAPWGESEYLYNTHCYCLKLFLAWGGGGGGGFCFFFLLPHYFCLFIFTLEKKKKKKCSWSSSFTLGGESLRRRVALSARAVITSTDNTRVSAIFSTSVENERR